MPTVRALAGLGAYFASVWSLARSAPVLWLGGMCGVGKTTAATRVARRHDMWLYPMDSRTMAHAEALGSASLEQTVDELWLDRSPQQMADEFEQDGRQRFALILEELNKLPDDGAPILVEGSFLNPDLVGPAALFIVADGAFTSEMLQRRGSLTLSRARDPELAHANRVRRDVLLGERLRSAAVVEIADIRKTEPLVEGFVRKWAFDWITRGEHGDVASRRQNANDRWLDQWRRYAAAEPLARQGTALLACECARNGCVEQVEVSYGEQTRPLLAH